ncbi:MAG TPA: phosphohistidine phosphatase SixA [Gemmatimonadaceae bacterium]|jgi:phosphohistidine phosphatase
MQLLVIRHAAAEDKDEWSESGKSDDERPLTADGAKDMAKAAKGLRAIIPEVDLIATSPLVRARQTAQIVASALGLDHVDVTDVLTPEASFPGFVSWLVGHKDEDTVAVVGHEPHLGILITWLLMGVEESRVEMKKGAACLIEFDGKPAKGKGLLRWSVPPGLLRRLSE